MTIAALIMLMVVVLVGLTAAPWNVTSAALTIAWTIPQVLCLAGLVSNMPTQVYAACDIAVIGVIYRKAPVRWIEDHAAILLSKSIGDRIVLLIFPVAWFFYIAPVDESTRWKVLMWLSVAQFFAAGAETAVRLGKWSKEHRGESRLPPLWSYRMAGERAGVG